MLLGLRVRKALQVRERREPLATRRRRGRIAPIVRRDRFRLPPLLIELMLLLRGELRVVLMLHDQL